MLLPDDFHVGYHQVPVKESCLQKLLSRKLETKSGLPTNIQMNLLVRAVLILAMKSDARREIGSGLLETKVYWLGRPMPLNINMLLVSHNFFHVLARTGQSF